MFVARGYLESDHSPSSLSWAASGSWWLPISFSLVTCVCMRSRCWLPPNWWYDPYFWHVLWSCCSYYPTRLLACVLRSISSRSFLFHQHKSVHIHVPQWISCTLCEWSVSKGWERMQIQRDKQVKDGLLTHQNNQTLISSSQEQDPSQEMSVKQGGP